MDEQTSRKKNSWGRFLLIWALILLLLGGASCYLLYQYLGIYEVTRPEPVMDAFLEENDLDTLIDKAKDNITFSLTEFEDPLVLYSSYLEAIDTSRSLSYRQDIAASTAEELVYIVRSGPSIICNVVLSRSDSPLGFGRYSWTVSEVRAASIPDLLPSLTISVDTVTGQTVSLNGTIISDSYMADTPVPFPDLTKFESSLDEVPANVTYSVGPLFGEVLLTDSAGNSIPPDGEPENGAVHYQVFNEKKSLKITAPEDLDVYINGVKLTGQDAFSSSLGVLEGLEAYTQNAACRTNVYRIDGLYLTPEISAVENDGTEVVPLASAENSFTFFHRGDSDSEAVLSSTAHSFFEAYMDYSAHAFEPTRFTVLLNKTLPQSSLYQYVYDSQQAMYWASGTQTEYSDLRYDNFHRISDYCIVCTVIYSADMTATNWYEQYSYNLENAYELAFVSTGGRWLAANMNVITE